MEKLYSLKAFTDLGKWYDMFETLNNEQKHVVLTRIMNTDITKLFWDEIDFFDMISNDFYYLASEKKFDEAITLFENFKNKHEKQYKEDLNWLEYYLARSYLYIKDFKNIEKTLNTFINKDIDPDLLALLLDVTMLNGYVRETKVLSVAGYHNLKESDGIVPWAIDELRNIAMCATMAEAYSNGNEIELDQILTSLKENNLIESNPECQEEVDRIKATIEILNTGKQREWSMEDFSIKNKQRPFNIFLFLNEFVYYLHKKQSVDLITAFIFKNLLGLYYNYISKERGGKFPCFFSKQSLDKYVAAQFSLLSLNHEGGVAMLPIMAYYINFLKDKNLIVDEEFEKFKKFLNKIGKDIGRICRNEGWRYEFLFKFQLNGKPFFTSEYTYIDMN